MRRRAVLAGLLVAAMSVPVLPALRAATPPAPAAPVTCSTVPAAGGDWPSYGHDLANTRFQDAEHGIGPVEAATLAPVWTFSSTAAGGEGDFAGTPVVADGCVFVASSRGWVFAINADDGHLVWKAKVPKGGINSSVGVDGGRVYVAVSNESADDKCSGPACSGPYLMAFDEHTGAPVWQTPALDVQVGGEMYGSPVVFDGMVFEGISGGAAELSAEGERYAFHGAFVLVDATTGALLKKTWTIPQDQWAKDEAGATVWSSPAVDAAAKLAYVGTGNPFHPQHRSPRADAILKIDLDRTHPTFGEILSQYDGTPETFTNTVQKTPCVDIPGNPPPYYPQGLGSCMDMDMDFGASPNLIHDRTGRMLVGEGQKSGVYHAFDPVTMKGVWQATVGPPSAVGGIVGSTAYDGYNVYGPVTAPGYVWSLSRQGAPNWLVPIGDAAHWGNPVSAANGVVYTVDLRGFLDGYIADTGVPVLQRPILAGANTGPNPVLSWGGVSIARGTVFAAVGITSLANGFVVAFRPGGAGSGGSPAPPPPPGPGGPGGPGGPVIVAGPGAQYSTYATPAMVVRAGGSLSFSNADLPQHDVTATVKGADGQPLFHSKLVGIGEVTPVDGVDKLPGGTYGFYCSIHPGMKGTLVVG